MWRWHAIEEIEHKGVAYDTWLHATRDWPRCKRWKVKVEVMLLVTRNFFVDRTQGALELLAPGRHHRARGLGAACSGSPMSAGHVRARSSAPGRASSCPASTPGSMTTAR